MEEDGKRGERLNPEPPPIIFLGTPDFAVLSLKNLVEAGVPVLAVVTQPDRPKGRGKKPAPSPVKTLAQELKIPIYQPERIRRQEVIEEIRSLQAQCAVVVAYGQILPQAFLDLFPLGALNVHASLLPRYRGAAPIQRSILAGDRETGVSIMLLDAGMDTGPVLSQKKIPIGKNETFGSVHDNLARVGAELLCETLIDWAKGRLQPIPQDDALATYAPPIRKDELRLVWERTVDEIVNTIRAFDPWPGGFAMYGGRRIKCFGASHLDWSAEGRAGEIVGQAEGGLIVLAGDGRALSIGELQLEGQRRMSAAEFLRGHPMEPGTLLQ